mmetsp:Transcript_8716/g.16460  ORF Transcript_8716/g.16460 Transcript_8716/m.16460 type:complete len:1159 (-) Transcript_8716:166-3642(-)
MYYYYDYYQYGLSSQQCSTRTKTTTRISSRSHRRSSISSSNTIRALLLLLYHLIATLLSSYIHPPNHCYFNTILSFPAAHGYVINIYEQVAYNSYPAGFGKDIPRNFREGALVNLFLPPREISWDLCNVHDFMIGGKFHHVSGGSSGSGGSNGGGSGSGSGSGSSSTNSTTSTSNHHVRRRTNNNRSNNHKHHAASSPSSSSLFLPLMMEEDDTTADVSEFINKCPRAGQRYDRRIMSSYGMQRSSMALLVMRGGCSFYTKAVNALALNSYFAILDAETVPVSSTAGESEMDTGTDADLDLDLDNNVTGTSTGSGSGSGSGSGGITIFHKKFDEKRRSRQGYDMDVLDSTMRNIGSVADFIESSGSGMYYLGLNQNQNQNQQGNNGKDPIQMLSFCTGLSFTCHLCKSKEELEKKGQENVEDVPECNCEFYLHHKLTTLEIKECVADLKVLNKADFKALLTWRERIRKTMEGANEDEDDDEDVVKTGVKKSAKRKQDDEDLDSDAEESRIQKEIEQLRAKKLREQKKVKKKERELQAKRRKRAALGMDLNAIEVPEQESMFSLTAISSAKDLEIAREVDLGKVTDEQIFVEEEKEEDDDVVKNEHGEVIAQGEQDDIDEETGYNYRLDRELDAAYDRYLANTKNKAVKTGTKSAKRSKREMRLKAAEQAKEDEELMMDDDTKKYAEMLQGPKDSDDESSNDEGEGVSSDDDDGFRSKPVTPSEHEKLVATKKKKAEKVEEMNPLIHRLVDESSSVKAARWFSNPLFENIGIAASLATMSATKETFSTLKDADDYEEDSDDAVEELSSDDEDYGRSRKRKKAERNSKELIGSDEGSTEDPITADSVLAIMPKTDKQLRHEKRLKTMERKERREKRRARLSGEADAGFEVVEGDDEDDDDLAKKSLEGLSDKEKKKILEARELIKAGLGQRTGAVESEGFEVVSAEKSKEKSLLPVLDQREYNSENEAYDSDDYAETLALGTMMLRKSKAKSLVDASYNRFAWNDPEDLPDWFLDDENKNYRPQLPIPPELLAKMKEKFMSLATRPIAKVAEARARKNKMARVKLAAAKKKAEAVANSSEMSEAMKLKAISKAMRGNDTSRPSKSYVVSKKGGGTKGGKGVKLVDKRMKNDKRAMDRATKKKKNGKKGGLTGSKRRRNHS